MSNNALRIRFLSFKDAANRSIPKLVVYVKKLAGVAEPSTSEIKLQEKDSKSSVILAFDETFDLLNNDEYCQILFIQSKLGKPIGDITLSRIKLIEQYICDSGYKQDSFPELTRSAVIEQHYTFHFTIQLLENTVKQHIYQGHPMQTFQFNEPVSCAVCRKFIWGLYRQGLKCSKCSLVTHRKCRDKIPFDCQNSLKKGAKSQVSKAHNFTTYSISLFKTLIPGEDKYCNHCGSLVFRHALKCTQCPFIIHKNCELNVPAMCKKLSLTPPPTPPESPTISLLPKFLDFKCIGRIGSGCYGKVYCVQHRPSQEYLAMKVVDGSIDDARTQLEIERKILFDYSHRNPYMINGYFSFHCGKMLFLAIELIDGDTLRVKIQRKRMNEEEIGFYLAEIISVLQYLHSNQIIYRDLKPEHIIINSAGHVRLVDYGLGGILETPNQYRHTICGTPLYLPPEIQIINGNSTRNGYNYSVDYWNLGLVFGQMLCGTEDEFKFRILSETDQESMRHEIKNAIARLTPDISFEARSCLRGLLEIDPKNRLGSTTSPHGLLRNHPFFSIRSRIDWEQIDEGLYKSMYKFQSTLSNESTDIPFTHLSLIRDTSVKEEWIIAGTSTCTPIEEERYESFDCVNESAWSPFLD
ncbi:hypothetical protein I4U23_003334 [Adineta vaga]|nr:hypothetical protein I4U23_003334 [Adineta vaga]